MSKSKLSLKWRIRRKMYDLVGRLGNYCNNHVGDEYAYAFYRFLAAIVYDI